jgi:hypothetical protein
MNVETGISFTANALLQLNARDTQAPAGGAHQSLAGETSKTELMRRALRVAGGNGLSARDLAIEARLANSGLVRALLKYDIARAHVRFDDGHYYLVENGELSQ